MFLCVVHPRSVMVKKSGELTFRIVIRRLQQQMGFWKTITPMGRVGRADELNGLAVFLSSDAARFVTGSNVFCDVSDLFDFVSCKKKKEGGGGLTDGWDRVVIMSIRWMALPKEKSRRLTLTICLQPLKVTGIERKKIAIVSNNQHKGTLSSIRHT